MKNYLLNSTPKPSKEIQNLLLEPYFPHSAPAKNQVRQLRRTFRLNQNENSLCPVDMSLDDNQSWRLPASPTRHKISYDNRSRFKAPITIHKKSIQPDFSFLNESLHEENSAANRTPERSINYLNRICEKLIEEQSEIKQQITQQKKTINWMRNQKHLSEIETSMAKQHFSRLPKIKQLRTENTAPCSEKSSPAVIRVLKIDPEIMNDNLFTFRIDEVEAFMKKTSNFPQSQQNSPKKVQRFPREVFTRKVKRTRL